MLSRRLASSLCPSRFGGSALVAPGASTAMAMGVRLCSTTASAADASVATASGDAASPSAAAAAAATSTTATPVPKKLKKKGTLYHAMQQKHAAAKKGSGNSNGRIPQWFVAHRARTLADLEANNNDKSNAGRVDPLILPSVQLINSYEHYCTASSCSGRVSVFHRAMPPPTTGSTLNNNANANTSNKGDTEANTDSTNTSTASLAEDATGAPMDVVLANKKRGNGLGTVFSSHDPLVDTYAIAEQVYKELVAAKVPTTKAANASSSGNSGDSNHNRHALAELLQVKFEPTILHTTCASMADAHRFIGVASESGHRLTGIVVSRAGKEEGRQQPIPPVAAADDAGDSSALACDAASASSSSSSVEACGEVSSSSAALEAVGSGWKITAKMQSMVCFDAPLYTATSGWFLHGGHDPLPDVFTDPASATAEEKALAASFIGGLDRLLKHGNALFEENEIRRGRFMATLKDTEAAAEARRNKKAGKRGVE